MQHSILELLAQDDRKFNAGGMCYGIAMAVIDYVLKCSELKQSDQKQLQPLGTRLREIITYQSEDKEKQAQRAAFFDAIMLYHASSLDALLKDEKALPELKQNFPTHPNNQTSFWAWNLLNNNAGNTKPLYENYSFMLHAPDSKVLEKKVISTLETLRRRACVFGALLSTGDHAMAAVYDQGRWWLINHDSFNYLGTTIDYILRKVREHKDEGGLSISLENSLGRLLKNSMVSIKVLGTLKDNTHQEIVRSLNNTIPENNQKKPAYFNLAMQDGHVDCVRAYFDFLRENKQLSEDQWISLIRSEARNGLPALYAAMDKGHADCVRAYFDFLREDNQLSEDQWIILIRSDSRDGFPALYAAMREGHADCVRAYFDFLRENKQLSEEQRIRLIRSDSREGLPALYVAMREGHVDCVRAYYDFLRENKQLYEEQRIRLIRSDSGEGFPAIYTAVVLGYTDCVRAYYDFLVNNSQLSALALRSLARAESNGLTLIKLAIDYNHEKIIDIYLHAVYHICKKTSIRSTQLLPETLQERYSKYSNDQFIRDLTPFTSVASTQPVVPTRGQGSEEETQVCCVIQ